MLLDRGECVWGPGLRPRLTLDVERLRRRLLSEDEFLLPWVLMLISLSLMQLLDLARAEMTLETEWEDVVDGERRRFLALLGDCSREGSRSGEQWEARARLDSGARSLPTWGDEIGSERSV